ncbi:Hypothetical predicted protein [Olea europaea subsp. europaea]|uniref:Uncharacterized protein n=1 Tax=Olea europaea subsp. europaea TaxID=158383 RepID=A0A8S0S214_OLEEU|nr:Hypothetical predicted protein [Olea europaea subsp. europaea]
MRVGRNAFPRKNQLRNEAPREDRTMFATFSKGYLMVETEIRHFFVTVYGNCIESFRMHEVRPYEQPLYAREILDGSQKAKFTINGKHAWMCKFVLERRDSLK